MGDGGPQRKGFVSVTDDADERFFAAGQPPATAIRMDRRAGEEEDWTGLGWAGFVRQICMYNWNLMQSTRRKEKCHTRSPLRMPE